MPNTAVFDRSDTLLGVCQALGDDFGFNPLWLRIGLAVSVLWNPVAVLVLYLALGVVVLASRLAFPARSGKAKQLAVSDQLVATSNDDGLPLAKAA